MSSPPPTPALTPPAEWLELLPACVIVIVDGHFAWANAAALQLMEAEEAADFVGRAVAELVHPLDLHRVEARIRHAVENAGTNPTTEFRVYTCRGHERVLAMTSRPLDFGGRAAVLAAFLDMTQRAAMEERLQETDRNFRRIMDTMQDVFYRTDAHGITRYVCPAVQNVLGYRADEIIGLPAAAFYPDLSERDRLVDAIREHGFVHDFPGRMQRKDGVIIDISISTHALVDERGEFAGVEGIWRDISQRKAMERELERLASLDDLTGLPNRRCTLQALEHAIERRGGRRETSPLCVLMLDLDHFKRVNDEHGHLVGDLALQHVASIMQRWSRDGDVLGRLGGEEFLLIVDAADLDATLDVAERIREAVQDMPPPERPGLALTVSIGVAQWRETDVDASRLLDRVDRAMYAAKNSGRNRVCTSSNELPNGPIASSI
ncbi:putative diguanylate cyclase YdaM [mine drainage metagenome]|jgi:diguanylate cyclase (GGDEF)-like protein/PAS domain S-box-containing protein|uniref:Putative diguanylate cyclase YdaM n=1 Tax=mine drainage metagenome TaxID=410659 RepID=A0A1J5RJR8_9ZZZZ